MPAAASTESPMPHRDRPRGHPSEQVVFRCPKELLEKAEALGRRSRTDALVELLDLAVDAMGALGDRWPQVVAVAASEQVSDGKALGQLAREALEKKGRR